MATKPQVKLPRLRVPVPLSPSSFLLDEEGNPVLDEDGNPILDLVT